MAAGPGQVAGLLGVSDLSTPVDLLAITGVRTAGWSATTIRAAAAADSGLALDTVDQMAVAMDLLRLCHQLEKAERLKYFERAKGITNLQGGLR